MAVGRPSSFQLNLATARLNLTGRQTAGGRGRVEQNIILENQSPSFSKRLSIFLGKCPLTHEKAQDAPPLAAGFFTGGVLSH